MKKRNSIFYLIILLAIVVHFFTFCTQQAKTDTYIADDDLISSEISKQNFSDEIFLGFSFDMDSLSVIQHCDSLIRSGEIWNFYLTQAGRDRMYVNEKIYPDFHELNKDEVYYLQHNNRTEPHLKIDEFEDNMTFITKLIFQINDTLKNEKHVDFGISIYENKLRSIDICFSGISERDKSDINWKESFDVLENNIILKYGKPIICNYENRIWIDGIIKIELNYNGIKSKGNYGLNLNTIEYSYYTDYYPYYILSYKNIVFEKQCKENAKRMTQQIEDEINQISEQDRLNDEFNPNKQW